MRQRKGRGTKSIDGNPLDGIEDVLASEIRRDVGQARRRRFRKRALFGAVGVLMFGAVATAGAGADIFPSTGVALVDDLLGAWQAKQDQQELPMPDGRHSGAVDVRPRGGQTSGVLTVPGATSPTMTTRFVSYASRDGSVCFAAVPAGSEQPDPQSAIACQSMPNVARELASRRAYVVGLRAGRPTVVSGFSAANVDSIRLLGPTGELAVRLSAPWKPDVPHAVELRSFVAFQQSFNDVLEPAQRPPVPGNLGQFRIRAQLDDGRVVDGG